MQIYVKSNRKDYGPYSLEQLRELVGKGTFLPHDSASVGDSDLWTIIEKIPGFQRPAAKAKIVDTATCPFCRDSIDAQQVQLCPGCGAPHHGGCWSQNGGCTVYGCSHMPSEEPIASPPGTPFSQSGGGHRASGDYHLKDQYENYPRKHRSSRRKQRRKISGMNRGQTIIVMKSGSIVPSVIGSLLGALIGACIWAGIAIATDGAEIGYVALLVGVLAGYGSKILSPGDIVALGMTAALCSIFGVLAGKYIFTAYSIPHSPDAAYEYYLQEMSTGSLTSEEMVSHDDYNEAFDQAFVELYGAKASEVTLTSYGAISLLARRGKSVQVSDS